MIKDCTYIIPQPRTEWPRLTDFPNIPQFASLSLFSFTSTMSPEESAVLYHFGNITLEDVIQLTSNTILFGMSLLIIYRLSNRRSNNPLSGLSIPLFCISMLILMEVYPQPTHYSSISTHKQTEKPHLPSKTGDDVDKRIKLSHLRPRFYHSCII